MRSRTLACRAGPSLFGNLHFARTTVSIKKDEQIDTAVALVFAAVAQGLSWRCRDRLAHLADELSRAFIEAHHWVLRVAPATACSGVSIGGTSAIRHQVGQFYFGRLWR